MIGGTRKIMVGLGCVRILMATEDSLATQTIGTFTRRFGITLGTLVGQKDGPDNEAILLNDREIVGVVINRSKFEIRWEAPL